MMNGAGDFSIGSPDEFDAGRDDSPEELVVRFGEDGGLGLSGELGVKLIASPRDGKHGHRSVLILADNGIESFV